MAFHFISIMNIFNESAATTVTEVLHAKGGGNKFPWKMGNHLPSYMVQF